MPRGPQHRPLYRQILREALVLAWKEKRFWPLALLAVFLQTAGIYDVFLLGVKAALTSPIARDQSWYRYVSWVQALSWVNRAALAQSVLFAVVLILCILSLAVVAQATLAGCLDRGEAGLKKNLQPLVQRAAQRIVPLIVLNVVMLGISQFATIALRAVAGGMPATTTGYIGFAVAALAYLLVLFIVTSLHIFSLNGMMADGLTLHEALTHAWRLLRTAWVTIAETALCMMLIGALLLGVSIAVAFFAGLPIIGF